MEGVVALFDKGLPVLVQRARQHQIVAGVVGAKHGVGTVDLRQEQPGLPDQLHGVRQGQAALLHPLVHGGAGINTEGQQSDIVGPHGVEGMGRVHGVVLPAHGAGQAVDGRHGQADSGGLQLLSCLDLLGHGNALVDLLQKGLVAGLQAQIGQVQACRPESFQVLRRLFQDAFRAGINGHPLTLRQILPDIIQDPEQMLRGQDQGVAVRQKHPADDARPGVVGPGQVLHHLLDGHDAEGLVLVHVAEGALVMAAPHGHLDDETVGLAGGTVDRTGIVHEFLLLIVGVDGCAPGAGLFEGSSRGGRRCARSGRGRLRRRPMACGSAAGTNLFPVGTGVPGKPGIFKTPFLFSVAPKRESAF